MFFVFFLFCVLGFVACRAEFSNPQCDRRGECVFDPPRSLAHLCPSRAQIELHNFHSRSVLPCSANVMAGVGVLHTLLSSHSPHSPARRPVKLNRWRAPNVKHLVKLFYTRIIGELLSWFDFCFCSILIPDSFLKFSSFMQLFFGWLYILDYSWGPSILDQSQSYLSVHRLLRKVKWFVEFLYVLPYFITLKTWANSWWNVNSNRIPRAWREFVEDFYRVFEHWEIPIWNSPISNALIRRGRRVANTQQISKNDRPYRYGRRCILGTWNCWRALLETWSRS